MYVDFGVISNHVNRVHHIWHVVDVVYKEDWTKNAARDEGPLRFATIDDNTLTSSIQEGCNPL